MDFPTNRRKLQPYDEDRGYLKNNCCHIMVILASSRSAVHYINGVVSYALSMASYAISMASYAISMASYAISMASYAISATLYAISVAFSHH